MSNPTAIIDGNDEFFTVAEVADILKTRRGWVEARIHSGDLPHLRLGKFIRISRSALREFIEKIAAEQEGH